MVDVIHFVPRADLDAQTNLNAFVYVCREKLTVFGADLPFDANAWSVTKYINHKARRSELRIVFSSWGTAKGKAWKPMAEPFLSFAKSFMRFQHSMRPTKSFGPRIAALRALEAALSEGGRAPNPVDVRHETLYRATQLIKDHFTTAGAYHVAGQLSAISDLLIEMRCVAILSKWHSPIGRAHENRGRVGKEFDQQREQKMPSPAALNALASAFRVATEPRDVVVTSIAAILCSAPDRISEVLLLESNCEVTHKVGKTDHAEYGLRWRPAKGADPMVKWIVRSMADVVKEAVSRIRKISEVGREVARWYEVNPKAIFLPRSLEHLRAADRLTMDELTEVLFVEGAARGSARAWCKSRNIDVVGLRGSQTASFKEIEKAVLAMLPSGFPIADADLGLKYSRMLCVVRKNTLHSTLATYRCAIEQVVQGQIYDSLAGSAAKVKWSIFSRLGFCEEDGTTVRVRSHQLRHYLNTLAQIGGLSQLDIAKWSGRRDVRQNTAYDHESSRDIAEHVRRISSDEHKPVGPLARLRTIALIPRDEFARLKIPTAHSTEFGYCIHDFAMTPCQIHRDCMNCDEQVCIKGDGVREENLRRHREETRALLDSAKAGQKDGLAGADRWIDHQTLTLRRLDQLCEILDDPRIPVGTLIQPSGVVPASRIEYAARRRRLLAADAPDADGP